MKAGDQSTSGARYIYPRALVLLLGLALSSCGATRVTLTYTVPAYSHAQGSCDPDSLRPLAAKGMTMLYGRPLNQTTYQFIAAHDVTYLWGQHDQFVVNLRPYEWLLRVVTAIGDSVSCPSNEVYKDARKGKP
jgi:hypothetical protein